MRYGCVIAIVAIVVVLSLITYAVFPSERSPSENSITVIDALGRTVEIDMPVENVIITGKTARPILTVAYMFPTAKDLLQDVDPLLQDVQLFKMIDPDISSKVSDWSGSGLPNVEEIAGKNPDVVILKTFMKSDVGDPLETLGINVVYVDLENLDTYLRDLKTLSLIFGDEQRGGEIADYYRQMHENTASRTSGTENIPKVLFLYYGTIGGTISFNVPGKGWLQTFMINGAGGYPLSEELEGTGWNQVSFEQIASWDPEIIFLVTYSNSPSPSQAKENLVNDPLWKHIAAVSENKIYAVPDDCGNLHALGSWDSLGSRWILGERWMAKKIRPDLFQDVDLVGEVREFYSTMYGLSWEDANQVVNQISGDFG